MKPIIVNVPSIKKPIQDSPGFAKKELATHKLDIMGWCQASCLYCSSPSGNYLRINKARFADRTEEQTGQRLYPGVDPALTLRWEDFDARLDEQLRTKPKDGSWGAGKVLMFSQLTDAFSPWAVREGLTRRTLEKVLKRTSFRIRVLTKFDIVGDDAWIAFFKEHPGRFVVGLSIGTLDDAWARKVEIGTSSPSARVRALHRLQDAGVPTFGMLCPVFPDVLAGDGVERLVEAIRPERCEMVWSEPYNDRANWRRIAESAYEGTAREVFRLHFSGPGPAMIWSGYALALYERVHAALGEHAAKHRYLLYQDGMTERAQTALRGAPGVLFQSDETKRDKKRLLVVADTESDTATAGPITTQTEADRMLPALLKQRSARFEAVFAPTEAIDISDYLDRGHESGGPQGWIDSPSLDAVRVRGGATPMHPAWVRKLQQAAKMAGVPFSLAWGEWTVRGPGMSDDQPRFRMGENGKDTQLMENMDGAGEEVWMQRVGAEHSGSRLDGVDYPEVP